MPKVTDDHELLDHELNRLPVTRTMKLQVTATARRLGLDVAKLQRQAIREYLDRSQAS